MSNYRISLEKLVDELNLKVLYTPNSLDRLFVDTAEIHRPGMELFGYHKYFEPRRLQLIGNQEFSYLASLNDMEKKTMVKPIMMARPPAFIYARGLVPSDTVMSLARECEVPILQSDDSTSSTAAAAVSLLNVELAPRVTRHGVLVEVYGEGIFIVGDSGVGKSETAIELVKRGHRMIADDAVEIRKVSRKALVGSSPSNIRHFSEIRGIGIVNIASLFGMGAVKPTEKINFIVNLEQWDDKKMYDRMGLSKTYTDILGIKVPVLTIPVRQGRNLAVIIEVAAMNNRQKLSGNDAAIELMKNLGMDTDMMETDEQMIELKMM